MIANENSCGSYVSCQRETPSQIEEESSIIRNLSACHPKYEIMQQLQHFQIIALDDQVLGPVKVHALFRARSQRAEVGA